VVPGESSIQNRGRPLPGLAVRGFTKPDGRRITVGYRWTQELSPLHRNARYMRSLLETRKGGFRHSGESRNPSLFTEILRVRAIDGPLIPAFAGMAVFFQQPSNAPRFTCRAARRTLGFVPV